MGNIYDKCAGSVCFEESIHFGCLDVSISFRMGLAAGQSPRFPNSRHITRRGMPDCQLMDLPSDLGQEGKQKQSPISIASYFSALNEQSFIFNLAKKMKQWKQSGLHTTLTLSPERVNVKRVC